MGRTSALCGRQGPQVQPALYAFYPFDQTVNAHALFGGSLVMAGRFTTKSSNTQPETSQAYGILAQLAA